MEAIPALKLSNQLDLNRRLLPLRIMQPGADLSCGSACACMILEYYGLLGERCEGHVSRAINACFGHPSPGTHPDRMVDFLRSEGFAVVAGDNGTMELIYDAIDEGLPVLVLDSSRGGRWRLIVGYETPVGTEDLEGYKIFLADPETGIAEESSRQFFKRWSEGQIFDRSFVRFHILATP
jgi:hypothetical protein